MTAQTPGNLTSAGASTSPPARLRVMIRGAVQGVGFRPFIYRLATEFKLNGWVNNSAQGVLVEVEGSREAVQRFLLRIEPDRPPRSSIQSLETAWLDPAGYPDFAIRESDPSGAKTALILPDIATCAECLHEIFDAGNRRYFYPFTNCTHCGPRFSIIQSLPYDRANTSMTHFTMCPQCQAEYDDPRDRRFHAQPNACPLCGPRLAWWDREGRVLFAGVDESRSALEAAAAAIREGQIVAVKGLGGFHLMVDASSETAVRRLRELKHREEKPLALMFPSLAALQAACVVSPAEERLLRSPEAPIVLLRRQRSGAVTDALANSIAPGNPNLGAMLPYTPLHHLLLSRLRLPVVATSGNRSDEPICIDENEARERLHGIADAFLVHNRPVVRQVDDSIVRVMLDREMVLRRARGYAPLPIDVPGAADKTILAVGAHLKNSIALAVGSRVFLSQHIGDLETPQAFEAFRRVTSDFQRLYEAQPTVIAADAHPDYLSTKFATDRAASEPTVRLVHVQHHVAHVLSCLAENALSPPVLGVAWDGTGYGLDGTVWGGEFFRVTDQACERVAHLRPFRLPGGDRAVKEPRRAALGLLFAMLGEAAFARADLAPVRAFSPTDLAALNLMLHRGLNAPATSSAGRLFDAVAALVGLRQQVRFEGQAAMELEFALEGVATQEHYSFRICPEHPTAAPPPPPRVLDWSPLIENVLADLRDQVPLPQISARFHNGLAELIVAVARCAGIERVVLSGGCFQNRYLTEQTVHRLTEAGFRPYWHQRLPPNDGGIALGQILGAMRQ